MSYLNILHISDLHLRSESTGRFNQNMIIDALSKDLESLREGNLQPDIIVFSGDIVQDADDNQYEEASTIVSCLAEAAGVDDDRVFIVAGNHDASRKAIGPNIPKLKDFRRKLTDIDSINDLCRNQSFVSYTGNVFGPFARFKAGFGNKYQTFSDVFLDQYFLKELNLAVICLNTSLLSGAGVSSDVDDRNLLAYPERSLVEALKRVPKGARTIVVGHHPLSFMNETAQDYLKPLFTKSVEIYLSGHMHRADPEQVSNSLGSCSFLQSGSLYASRRWWNGYALISMINDVSATRVTYRKWQERRREFGLASELNDDGVVYLPPESSPLWSSIQPRVNRGVIDKWRVESLLPYLNTAFCDGIPLDREDVFVEPEFERDVYVETDAGLEKTAKPEIASFQAAMESTDNLLIAASDESGKTTLIRKWAMRMASTPFKALGWSVPAVVKFEEIKRYLAQFEGTVKSKVQDLPLGVEYNQLLADGMITLFIDDADLRASDRKATLDAFIARYPKVRYVILTGTTLLQGAGIAPVLGSGVNFVIYRLKSLRKSQLLSLIEGHGTKDPTKADQLLQRMVQEASSLNVPITPVTGTFLIQIYTEDSSKPLINRANLIERYVEIILEKFAPDELIPDGFDYRNKSDVLSYIASWMCQNDIYDVEHAKIIALVDDYLKEFGLIFSSVDLVRYFIQARIFALEATFVSFRLSAFLGYFAALRMTEDTEFKEFIFDKENYLNFRSEISFYAAISRKDHTWLLEMHRRFREASEEAWADAPSNIRNGTLLDDFVPPKADAKEEDLFSLEKKIFNEPLTEEERRVALDGDDNLGEPASRNDSSPSAPVELPSRWYAQLTLLSEMLKNMELINTATKELVLRDVIQGWLRFTCLTMGLVPTLARDRKLKLGGVEYAVLFPDDVEPGEIARRLLSYLPISTAKTAAYFLGTEKLRGQIEAGIRSADVDKSVGSQFIRGSILAQIGVDDLSSVMEDLGALLQNHRYLQEVFVRQMAEIVVRFRLPPKELSAIKLLAANTMATLEQAKGWRAAQRRTEIIQSLTSSRLRIQAGNASREV